MIGRTGANPPSKARVSPESGKNLKCDHSPERHSVGASCPSATREFSVSKQESRRKNWQNGKVANLRIAFLFIKFGSP